MRSRFSALARAIAQGALAATTAGTMACGAPARSVNAPVDNVTGDTSTMPDLDVAYYDLRSLLVGAGVNVDATADPTYSWSNGAVAEADLERLAGAGRGVISDIARYLRSWPDLGEANGVWVAADGTISSTPPEALAYARVQGAADFARVVAAMMAEGGRPLGATVRSLLRALGSDYVDLTDLSERDDLDDLPAPRSVAVALAWQGLLQQGMSDADESLVRRWSASNGDVVAIASLQPCWHTLTLAWVSPRATEPFTIASTGASPADAPATCGIVRGRATAGLSLDPGAAPLARAAAEEALSVASFERLARELEAFGAPAELVTRARAAADDERRHAAAMARLAGAPPPAYDVACLPLRDEATVARENAVEGCVHEAFAAVIALHQGHHARADLAPTYAAIADDECAHAELAWDVAAWLEPRLSAADRTSVQAARTAALAALPVRAAAHARVDRAATPAHGLPSAPRAERLARQLATELAAWS